MEAGLKETENRRSLGRRGEEEAARYLTEAGMKILERNFVSRQGEIDIIQKKRTNRDTGKCRYTAENEKDMQSSGLLPVSSSLWRKWSHSL